MAKASKEFLFNAALLSFILSAVFSILFTQMTNAQQASYVEHSSFEGHFIFVIFFLVLYMFHLLLSLISFILSRFTKYSLVIRLMLFNVIGILLIAAISLLFEESMILYIFISLIIFSVVSVASYTSNKASNH